MNISDYCGIILAGGKSSRMGFDKSLAEINGKTMLEIAYDHLKEIGLNQVYVSGSHNGFDCLTDTMPFAGPAAAIVDCYLKSKKIQNSKVIIIIPVDMPMITDKLIHELLKHINKYELVYFKNKPLPCAIKTKSVAQIAKQCSYADCSLKQLFSKISSNIQLDISLDFMQEFININTQKDLANLQKTKG